MNRRKGHDPIFTYRAPAELVAKAKQAAANNGTTLSEIIRNALTEYINTTGET